MRGFRLPGSRCSGGGIHGQLSQVGHIRPRPRERRGGSQNATTPLGVGRLIFQLLPLGNLIFGNNHWIGASLALLKQGNRNTNL
eukprot:s5543_g2.t1